MKCGAAAHAGRDMTGPALQDAQQPFADPGLQFCTTFPIEVQTCLPHAFGDMNKIEHDQRVIALFPEEFPENLDLRLVAVHQRHPPLSSLRITPPRLAERLTDDLIGRLFQACPNTLTLRFRPVWFFPLVPRRQTPQYILCRPWIGRDRVDPCYRRHSL